MLTVFRNLIRSKVALVLIGLLILSLAVWGITDIFKPGLGASLVKAGNRTVEVTDVDRYANNFVRSQQNQGNDVTKQDLVQSGRLDQIINLLADRQLTAAYFDKLGISASDKAATQLVRSMDAARNEITGEFDVDTFRNLIAQQGYSETQFERAILDDLTFDLVENGISAALQPSDAISDLWNIYQAEARNIAFFITTPEDLPEAVDPPTDEELEAFYAESEAALTEPERRQFSVIALNETDFYHQVTIDDADLRNEYEAQQRRFSLPGTRTYEVARFDDPDRARQALGPLLGGNDFASVVTDGAARIEAPVTSEQSEISDQALAQAVFQSPVNVWSGPVQTLDGRWALFRVTEEEAGEAIPFEEVKEEIRRELTSSRAQRMLTRAIDDIDDAVGAGLKVEEMADILGSPVFTYPPVDQRGRTKDGMLIRNLSTLEGALEYGFQLFPNETSDRREGEGTQYVIQLDKIVEPRIPELDEIREELRNALQIRRTQEAFAEFVEGIQERIDSGASSLTVEAEALGRSVERPPQAITRQSGAALGFSQSAVGQIFSAKLDEAFAAPLQSGLLIGTVEAIQVPDAQALESMRSETRANLVPVISNDLLRGLSSEAEKNIDYEINSQMIETYLSELQVTE